MAMYTIQNEHKTTLKNVSDDYRMHMLINGHVCQDLQPEHDYRTEGPPCSKKLATENRTIFSLGVQSILT